MFTRIIPVAAVLLSTGLLAGTASAQAPRPVAAPTGAATWQIDPVHSELTFRVRHLVSRVRGSFDEWGGTIVADPQNLAGGNVDVRIKTASINTNQERRDNHLRGDDFFAAEKHPEISFRSKRVVSQGEKIQVHGDLTMRGVTKPVVLEGQYLGLTRDAQGTQRIGFEAETTINRQDFGVSWNNLVEGAAMLGDEVTIEMVVAAVKK